MRGKHIAVGPTAVVRAGLDYIPGDVIRVLLTDGVLGESVVDTPGHHLHYIGLLRGSNVATLGYEIIATR